MTVKYLNIIEKKISFPRDNDFRRVIKNNKTN